MEIKFDPVNKLNEYINKVLCFITTERDNSSNSIRLICCKLTDTDMLGSFIVIAKFYKINSRNILKIFTDINEAYAFYEYLIGG